MIWLGCIYISVILLLVAIFDPGDFFGCIALMWFILSLLMLLVLTPAFYAESRRLNPNRLVQQKVIFEESILPSEEGYYGLYLNEWSEFHYVSTGFAFRYSDGTKDFVESYSISFSDDVDAPTVFKYKNIYEVNDLFFPSFKSHITHEDGVYYFVFPSSYRSEFNTKFITTTLYEDF